MPNIKMRKLQTDRHNDKLTDNIADIQTDNLTDIQTDNLTDIQTWQTSWLPINWSPGGPNK